MLGLNLSESRVLREEAARGEARARQQGKRSLILCQPPCECCPRSSSALSLEQLESLGEALLDFAGIADLEIWLQSDDRLAVGDHRPE